MTRSSRNWQRLPGGFDPLHIRRRHYASSNPWGFPDLLPQDFSLPHPLPMRSYRERDDSGQRHAAALCHFFLDDYRFESVWTKPDTALNRLHGFYGALTPDFSLYADWPLAVQQWNHYRRQWLGRYWQRHGLRVIPTVNWSTPESFDCGALPAFRPVKSWRWRRRICGKLASKPRSAPVFTPCKPPCNRHILVYGNPAVSSRFSANLSHRLASHAPATQSSAEQPYGRTWQRRRFKRECFRR